MIEYTKEGRIATLRINRPEAMGALNIEGMKELTQVFMRSEERRVGKECRSRWSPYH